MNERIKQLAEQATLAVTKPDGHYVVQAWQAKFAELLVLECISTLDRDDGATHHSELLLEHFGVEE